MSLSQLANGAHSNYKQHRKKVYRLSNRIAHAPDDVEAIREYVELRLPDPGTTESSDVLDVCDQLDAFLAQRAQEVGPSNLNVLLELGDQLDAHRAAAVRKIESRTQTSAVDDVVEEAVETWRSEGLDGTIPTDPEEARSALDRCLDVQAYVRSRKEKPINGLSEHIDELRAAIETDSSLERGRSIIDAALQESSGTEAAYILQTSEQVVRQLLPVRSQVGTVRAEQIGQLVRRLEDASEKISQRERNQHDQETWKKFLQEHGETLEDAKSLNPVKLGSQFDNHDERFGSEVPAVPNKPVLTAWIKKLETLIQELDRTLSHMREPSNRDAVRNELEAVSNAHEGISQRRQQVYNQFAMARLKSGFAKAQEDGVGLWDDKEEIANVLVDHLAELDQRYLTSEVARCYSEVFETLYGKLKKAKGKDDFDEEGRKLNALKRMYDTETVVPDQF